MFASVVGKIWKLLPSNLRVRFIRATQTTFTVSVGVIVTDHSDRVLLLDHLLRPASGWGIPGGFLDAGENPEVAAKRELFEETGIDLANLRLVEMRTIERHVEFIFRATTTDEVHVLSREILGFGWFQIDELPPEMSQTQQSLIRRILSEEFDKTKVAV
jgi:ADP-ribose pyrophosphatase YjhB (NUDIX family)